MNSWFGERCTFEKLGVKAESDRVISRFIPRNSEGRWMPYYSAPSQGHLVHSQTKSLGPSLRRDGENEVGFASSTIGNRQARCSTVPLREERAGGLDAHAA